MNAAGGLVVEGRILRLRLAAVLVGLFFLSAALSYLVLARRDAESIALEQVRLQVRLLEAQTSSLFDTASLSMTAAAEGLRLRGDADAVSAGRLLTEAVAGRPSMRSLSVVDREGRVLASTHPDNVDRVIDLRRLGGWPAADEERFAGLFQGRDLIDLAPSGAKAPARRATGMLLLRTVPQQNGALLLVAVLNPDSFSTQYALLLDEAADRALLMSYDGQVLTAGTQAALQPGASARALAPFQSFLPRQEHGAYIGPGIDGEPGITAFRVVRRLPLVVLSEQPYEVVHQALAVQLRWSALAVILGWVFTAVMALLIERAMRSEHVVRQRIDEAHAEVARAEERWKTALEGAALSVWDIDLASGRAVVSPRMMAMLGYAREAFAWSMATWEALVHEADRPSMRQAVQAHLEGRQAAFEAELRLRCADGQWRWSLWRGKVTERDATGRPLRFAGTAMDIQDRKLAESALRGIQARQSAILDSALDAIITSDAAGRVIDLNASAEAMFGCTAAVVRGALMEDLFVPPADRPAHRKAVARYLATGVSAQLNRRRVVRAQRCDGTVFPAELAVVPVPTDEGVIFTATIRDVTQLQGVQEELAASRARELAIGQRIQQELLVERVAEPHPQAWLAAFSQASRGIDGDFLDVVRLGEDQIDLVAGDVMGKGIPAALLGAATKLEISRSVTELLARRAEGGELPPPHAIVATLSRRITPHLQALEAFVTLVYLRLDLRRGTLTWVGCGHEEALVIRAAGGLQHLQNQHPPVGVLSMTDFDQGEVPFAPGDALFLCSDGASDALRPDGQRVGRDRIDATIRRRFLSQGTPAMALHGLRSDLLRGAVELVDDVTLALLVRRDPGQLDSRAELPVDLGSLAPLRRFVQQGLHGVAVSDVQAGLFLTAVVEAFTNIVRHARGLLPGAPVEAVMLRADNMVRCELRYLGESYLPPDEPPVTDFAAFPEGGFGLQIIKHGADEARYLHQDGVNIVRLGLLLPDSPHLGVDLFPG